MSKSVAEEITPLLQRLGVRRSRSRTAHSLFIRLSRVRCIARVHVATPAETSATIGKAHEAFLEWRKNPGASTR